MLPMKSGDDLAELGSPLRRSEQRSSRSHKYFGGRRLICALERKWDARTRTKTSDLPDPDTLARRMWSRPVRRLCAFHHPRHKRRLPDMFDPQP